MMNAEQSRRASGAAAGFVIAIVLFVAAGVAAKLLIPTPAIDADRNAERSKALAELQAAENKALYTAQVIDAQRGIVRLPIDKAIDLAAKNWSSAAAARADLAAREEKATATVKPVSFE
jgi:hypothetical protein